MTTNLSQIFTYADQKIRTVLIDTALYIAVVDLCRVLGIANSHQAADRIDPDWVCQARVIDSMGREQQTNVVNEPGMYQLIFMSDKTGARKFARWVFEEVLPEIRRTGSYQTPGTPGYRPLTYTFDEAAAMLRQHYWVPVLSVNDLTRQLRSAGIVKQTLAPRAPYAALFWFTGSSWNVQPFAIPQLADRLTKARRSMYEQHEFHYIQERLQLEGLGGPSEAAR